MSLDWTALSDGELATLSIAGRQAAFAEIVRRYRQPMFRLSRAFLGDADDALDVTQEAFVAAHQALSRYDPNRSMQAWLTTIAVESESNSLNTVPMFIIDWNAMDPCGASDTECLSATASRGGVITAIPTAARSQNRMIGTDRMRTSRGTRSRARP